ncbi:hypothetical protein GobsT_69310 [Gemmata obscuriglobus]|uniref:HEAT repeat domain-containing protein n=1 Tax=Gemmata obscuriglobus TaxID=114 RepID=A0A2Z3HKD6_9BACT|nr:hypothetical protein [Gemmata obscuriglobus]AWM41940.1 hypothetical protein C1280_36410 [Gemmata obscuriglobus]QEG32080.1 hypothetical protein GobsT_69310 [Gemmata obscuriglobus]VTS11433.1 hypothetical protein : Uncharacterized protein OS=Isosphaera pallida (strain ATCC 43644 / DSM 9630 / IS1B) GN=Isop_3205 PE=4 SV=1 [Gemmata obscuriglobus UQM 2246]
MPRSLIALVLCAGFGPSAEPPLKAPSPEQLTRQLGAPEFATREQASESLRVLGAAALPAVQRATTSDDPEIRRRALALLPAIQARIAFTPRRVAIDPRPITLAAALHSLRQQTGYVVTADPPAGKELYTFGVPDGTFWEAVDRIAERTNRSIVTTRENIRLVPGTARSPFTVRDGAFRVTLENIHEDRNIDFSQGTPGRHDHKLTLHLSVLAEPRFAILGGGPAQFAEVVDDRGGKLREAPDEGRTLYFGWDITGTEYEASVHGLLRRSPKQGTRLATVSGVIPVLCTSWICITDCGLLI